MDSFLTVSFQGESRAYPACHVISSTSKVLSWLEDSLLSSSGSSCEYLDSYRACASWVVRGKILEDRLVRLNSRRRTVTRRDAELDRRRRMVEAMARQILNSSGETVDITISATATTSVVLMKHPLTSITTSRPVVVEKDDRRKRGAARVSVAGKERRSTGDTRLGVALSTEWSVVCKDRRKTSDARPGDAGKCERRGAGEGRQHVDYKHEGPNTGCSRLSVADSNGRRASKTGDARQSVVGKDRPFEDGRLSAVAEDERREACDVRLSVVGIDRRKTGDDRPCVTPRHDTYVTKVTPDHRDGRVERATLVHETKIGMSTGIEQQAVKTSVTQDSGTSSSRGNQNPIHGARKSRSRLHSIRSAFKKLSRSRPSRETSRTVTTQTSPRLLRMPTQTSLVDRKDNFTDDGLQCTWC